jgi:hypothetical protein
LLARNMLNESNGKGEIIVISDGDLRNYPEVITVSGLKKWLSILSHQLFELIHFQVCMSVLYF